MSESQNENQYNEHICQQEQNMFNNDRKQDFLSSYKNIFSYISFVAGLKSLLSMGNCFYFILSVVACALALDKKEIESRLAIAGAAASFISYFIWFVFNSIKILLTYFSIKETGIQLV